MFTGIVEEVGRVRAVRRSGSGSGNAAEIVIEAASVLEGTRVGDSIAVAGVCLTATRLPVGGGVFAADAMPETLRRSSLGSLASGAPVNLERALLPTTRLGGHIVSGHIDGTVRVVRIAQEGNAHVVTLAAAPEIMRYIVEKGSVALDGVSVTVAHAARDEFAVSLIPHTFANTTLGGLASGDVVNVECDVIGKYVERLMRLDAAGTNAAGERGVAPDALGAPAFGSRPAAGGLTMEFLLENGF